MCSSDLAAECANDQGFFWDYHDILFLRQGDENSGVFKRDRLKEYARQMAAAFPSRPFDQKQFDACVDSGVKYPEVGAFSAAALQAGVQSTPSFMINGALISGALPVETFRQLLDQLKAQKGR